MGIAADIGGVAGAALGIIAVVLTVYLAAFGFGILLYILQALGLYTIAQRRGIRNPWLAWLPVANVWILGSISDQYRYVTRRQIRNKRKVLLALQIALAAVGLICSVVYAAAMVHSVLRIPEAAYYMSGSRLMDAVALPVQTGMIAFAVLWAVGLILVILEYICLYDLFASCSPDNKVLFLVLSILFNVTLPFFVFACRKKDGGMPPRRDASEVRG